MNHNLIPVKRLVFIPLDSVYRFIPTGNTVEINSVKEFEIPFKKGTATYNVNGSNKKPGILYSSSIACAIKESFDHFQPGIILLERCGSSTLVIGDPEVPVFIDHASGYENKTISIGHECGHEPYILKE